jgi:peptidoglycan/xylan/chitin deacetylase (PgdA/CDA1 family)
VTSPPGQLIVYWDYDTQWGADCSRASGGPKTWGPSEFVHTESLLELHGAYRVPACFAVVGAAALPGERPYHDPGQVRGIAAAGHEIASHAFRHEWLPGLTGEPLRETLQHSREVLEDCIGAEVVSFVPPYNQPFDYWQSGSVSLSERREARSGRTDLPRLCEALRECGYRTCRVSYRPLLSRLLDLVARDRLERPSPPKTIGGITCLRLTTAGFGTTAAAVLERVAREGGLAITYGHPHSLDRPGEQHRDLVMAYLRLARSLSDAGRLRFLLPRELARQPEPLTPSASS